MEKVIGLAGISAVTTALVHEWLHASDITQDIPSLGVIGDVGAGVGSVSVGLAIAVVVGVMLNYYLGYEEET